MASRTGHYRLMAATAIPVAWWSQSDGRAVTLQRLWHAIVDPIECYLARQNKQIAQLSSLSIRFNYMKTLAQPSSLLEYWSVLLICSTDLCLSTKHVIRASERLSDAVRPRHCGRARKVLSEDANSFSGDASSLRHASSYTPPPFRSLHTSLSRKWQKMKKSVIKVNPRDPAVNAFSSMPSTYSWKRI